MAARGILPDRSTFDLANDRDLSENRCEADTLVTDLFMSLRLQNRSFIQLLASCISDAPKPQAGVSLCAARAWEEIVAGGKLATPWPVNHGGKPSAEWQRHESPHLASSRLLIGEGVGKA